MHAHDIASLSALLVGEWDRFGGETLQVGRVSWRGRALTLDSELLAYVVDSSVHKWQRTTLSRIGSGSSWREWIAVAAAANAQRVRENLFTSTYKVSQTPQDKRRRIQQTNEGKVGIETGREVNMRIELEAAGYLCAVCSRGLPDETLRLGKPIRRHRRPSRV